MNEYHKRTLVTCVLLVKQHAVHNEAVCSRHRREFSLKIASEQNAANHIVRKTKRRVIAQ
jgi:hypothetical protein